MAFKTRFPLGGGNDQSVLLSQYMYPEAVGNVYFVSSVEGAATGPGASPANAYNSIDAAVGACTANNGDVILVLPGHVETISGAASLNLDVAGITVVGVGHGTLKPRLNFTGTAGTVAVGAANIKVKGLRFLCSIDSLVIGLDVNDNDFTVEDCDFEESATTTNALVWVDVTGSGANECDNFVMKGCTCRNEASGATHFISIGAVHDNIQIRNCWVEGDFSTAAIGSGSILTNVLIADNYISNTNAGDWAVEFTAAATGLCVNNRFYADVAATTLDPGSMKCIGNRQVNAIDSADTPVPAPNTSADTTEAALWGANGITTWPSGAAPGNAVSIAEGLRFVSEAITDGAAFSQTVDPGGTARASVELVLADLAAMLAGSAGITTFPAAAAPANSVSLAEVVREIFDQQDKAVTNTTATLVNGTTLFTIAGGPIEILSLVARCATTNDGTASTLQWSADPPDGVAVTISAASASLASVAAGGMVTFQGTTLATAPLVSASGANIAQAVTNGVVVGAGIITSVVGVGSTTGTWQHHLRYRPLSRGVTVS